MLPTEPAREARQKTIAESLRLATKTLHRELDGFIVSRMPLALPPQAVDPSVYTSGILHIAPVYIAFETLWQEIVNSPAGQAPATDTGGADLQNPELTLTRHSYDSSASPQLVSFRTPEIKVPGRVRTMLSNLKLPGLLRSGALKRDLRQLTGWSATEVEEQLRQISSTGPLRDFTAIIQQSIQERPHVLVAYTYILYMALFTGGRLVRASLESVGDEFWDRKASVLLLPTVASSPNPGDLRAVSPMSTLPPHGEVQRGSFLPENPHKSPRLPLDFLHFNTPHDGEDLKEEYEQHLLDAEPTLTEAEKDDIIKEAIVIFEEMHTIVQQLDERFTPPNARDGSLYAPGTPLRSERLRNSVAVTKERNERKAARGSGDSYGYDNDDLESKAIVETPKRGTGRTSEDSTSSTRSVRFAEQVSPSEKHKRAFSFDGQDDDDDDDSLEDWVRGEDTLLRTVLLVLACAVALMGFGLITAISVTSWWKGGRESARASLRAAAEAAAKTNYLAS